MTDGLRIERATTADAVAGAADLFDDALRSDAVGRFLADDRHHLLIAYRDGEAAGFASGCRMAHPDKGTEMFLYELAVGEDSRRPRHRPLDW